MTRFAETTSVPVEKSKAEIESLLSKYGADRFMSGWDQKTATVAFVYEGKPIQFTLALPDYQDKQFWFTPEKKLKRTDEQAYKVWEQACRQRWRALALVIKAKLEAIESGITTFDNEFLAHIVCPSGRTIGEEITPLLEAALSKGKMPKLLPMFAGPGGDK